jgi:septal ring factor EnvC (AmiA/AmiB activator)
MMKDFSHRAQQLIQLLYEEEECRKPRKTSEKQRETGREQVKKMREEGGGFDQMPDSEHKKVSREGGESKRRKQLPECGT